MQPPALFRPLPLRGLTLANRIAASPMTQYSGEEGCPVPWHAMHVGSLATSGAGLVIMEATAVEAIGRTTAGCLGLYSDANEAAMTRLVADIRSYTTTPLAIQLGHAGRRAAVRKPWDADTVPLPVAEGGWGICGPTDEPYRAGSHVPEALDEAGIHRVIRSFGAAAARAARCGFDLIELHGAHGYLMHSFTSPLSNTRTDGWGGSRERRMRFTLEAVSAVRAAWPADKPLGFRVPGSDFIEGGLTVEDAVALGRELKGIGVDYIVPSVGLLDSRFRAPAAEPGYMVHFAERIRREVGIPTMAVGMILKPRQADAIIASGQADIAGIGRGLLNDPRWAWHAATALGMRAEMPRQYEKVRPANWPGYRLVRPDEAETLVAAEPAVRRATAA
jgi:2,4-dienoyl-CoA reductase-like NADH-dependent reductase (Old Yellow Enzyme family)